MELDKEALEEFSKEFCASPKLNKNSQKTFNTQGTQNLNSKM